MLLYILQYLFVIIITTNVMVVHGQNASYTTWKELHMATHECSACLQETIQGATDVVGTLVLPNSVCTAPGGGRHSWARKTPPAVQGNYLHPVYFIELLHRIYSVSVFYSL